MAGIKTNELQIFSSIESADWLLTEGVTKGTGRTPVSALAERMKDTFFVVPNTAPAHNALYRGKDLTDYFKSGEMSKAIAAGTFEDIFPGDYILQDVTNSDDVAALTNKWEVADLDYYFGGYDSSGRSEIHHVVMMPDRPIQVNVNMNDKVDGNDTTVGGFVGSKMYKEILPKWATGVKAAFGADHVWNHKELLSKRIAATAPSAAGADYVGSSDDWGWYSMDVSLPSEPMIYGATVFGSSGFDVGEAARQLSIFRHKKWNYDAYYWFWLRAVASASWFCNAGNNGYANRSDASNSNSSGGLRLYFLLR